MGIPDDKREDTFVIISVDDGVRDAEIFDKVFDILPYGFPFS